jgi:hypothetical protein
MLNFTGFWYVPNERRVVIWFYFSRMMSHVLCYVKSHFLCACLCSSSYPLGGYVTAGLILSTSAALATTVYATVSCRFVVLTFTSNIGNFEEYFNSNVLTTTTMFTDNDSSNTGSSNLNTYRAAVGLYQWLRPFDTNDWTVGTCVGYQQTMIDAITDTMFDVSRTMSIFAILIAIFQFCWMFLSSCLDMNRIQCYLFVLLSLVGVLCTGFTFLFHRSMLCTSEFDATATCHIDQGGLVMIAAALLWMITLGISVYYVVPTVMAISSSDSIDFELRKARTVQEKNRLSQRREQRREHQRRQQEPPPQESTTQNNKNILPTVSPFRRKQQYIQDDNKQTTGNVRTSYSFDSLQSWIRPIPKRKQRPRSVSLERNTTKATTAPVHSTIRSSQQQQQQPQQHRNTKSAVPQPSTPPGTNHQQRTYVRNDDIEPLSRQQQQQGETANRSSTATSKLHSATTTDPPGQKHASPVPSSSLHQRNDPQLLPPQKHLSPPNDHDDNDIEQGRHVRHHRSTVHEEDVVSVSSIIRHNPAAVDVYIAERLDRIEMLTN